MEIGTRVIEREGRHFGELRIEMTSAEAEGFSGDGPFGLLLDGDDFLLLPEVPDDMSPFAVTNAVEHLDGGLVLVFHLNSRQMTRLKSVAPNFFPGYISGSRVLGNRLTIQLRQVSLKLSDGEHHVLFIAPEAFFEGADWDRRMPFDPIVEDGVWPDDGYVRYLDQRFKLHEEPPAAPYLLLRGKKIDQSEMPKSVWEFEDGTALQTYKEWSEAWNRHESIENN
jgi:hypothetical protein